MAFPYGTWRLSQPKTPDLQLAIHEPDAHGGFTGEFLDGTTIRGTFNQNNNQIAFLTYPFGPLTLPAAAFTGTVFADGQSIGGVVSAAVLEVILASHNHRPIPPPEPWFAVFVGAAAWGM